MTRFRVARASLADILAMRELYRAEMRCQIVHDSFHARGFTDSYLLYDDNAFAGYGAVAGDPHPPRTIVKEFFVLPAHRDASHTLMDELIRVSQAEWIEAQTNDLPLIRMLERFARDVALMKIVFADTGVTELPPPDGAVFRRVTDTERTDVFAHSVEGVGDWCVDVAHRVVATGGLMLHYNPPYADIYMEVAVPHRRHGIGSYLVQELKRVAHNGAHPRRALQSRQPRFGAHAAARRHVPVRAGSARAYPTKCLIAYTAPRNIFHLLADDASPAIPMWPDRVLWVRGPRCVIGRRFFPWNRPARSALLQYAIHGRSDAPGRTEAAGPRARRMPRAAVQSQDRRSVLRMDPPLRPVP